MAPPQLAEERSHCCAVAARTGAVMVTRAVERLKRAARAASGTAAATWRTVLFARGTTLTAPCVSPLVVMEIGFVSVQTLSAWSRLLPPTASASQRRRRSVRECVLDSDRAGRESYRGMSPPKTPVKDEAARSTKVATPKSAKRAAEPVTPSSAAKKAEPTPKSTADATPEGQRALHLAQKSKGNTAMGGKGGTASNKAGEAAVSTSKEEVQAAVLKLVRELDGGKAVHIAKLSFAYAKHAGHSVKKVHKAGMRDLIATQLADQLLLQGENNDTFVRVHTPLAANLHWVRRLPRPSKP